MSALRPPRSAPSPRGAGESSCWGRASGTGGGLCDVSIPESSTFSRAFPSAGGDHPLLAGISPDWLRRWNGLPGTVAVARIRGRAVEAGRSLLWAVEPKTTVVAGVPAAEGGGKVLFCQLDLRSHVSPGSACDPVAERILLNLLAW
jgi:hypothetical protein